MHQQTISNQSTPAPHDADIMWQVADLLAAATRIAEQLCAAARIAQESPPEPSPVPTAKGGYRPAEAAEYLGISRWMLYQRLKSDPNFPRPVHLTPRCVIFDKKSLDAYLARRSQ